VAACVGHPCAVAALAAAPWTAPLSTCQERCSRLQVGQRSSRFESLSSARCDRLREGAAIHPRPSSHAQASDLV
jgi:hypothetical protein